MSAVFYEEIPTLSGANGCYMHGKPTCTNCGKAQSKRVKYLRFENVYVCNVCGAEFTKDIDCPLSKKNTRG